MAFSFSCDSDHVEATYTRSDKRYELSVRRWDMGTESDRVVFSASKTDSKTYNNEGRIDGRIPLAMPKPTEPVAVAPVVIKRVRKPKTKVVAST